MKCQTKKYKHYMNSHVESEKKKNLIVREIRLVVTRGVGRGNGLR